MTAAAGLQFLLHFVPAKIPRLHEVTIDGSVLVFALLVSVLTGIAFGLAPALQAAKSDPNSAIREGSPVAGYSARTSRLRRFLIVAELALAVMLMVGAGLLLRTFWGLLQQNPGFNPSGVVAANIWLPVPNNPQLDPYAQPGAQAIFVREVLRRLNARPGVSSAAIASDLPTTAKSFRLNLGIQDRPIPSAEDQVCELSVISPDYFKVMQAPLLSGRFFADSDEAAKDRVIIIDDFTARHYWPGEDVIGKHIRFGRSANPSAPWLTIVGVVSNMNTDGLDAKRNIPHLYIPLNQSPTVRSLVAVLRTSLATSTLESQLRRDVQDVDPKLPVFNLRTMNEVIGASLASRRFSSELIGGFAVLALLLSSIGIYGLLAYMVGQRSHEIGVRMALGAHPFHILKMVLNQGAVLAGIGVLAGLLFAALAAPLLSSLLYGIHTLDPLVFFGVPVVLMIVAMVASFIPARRASRVDPIVALRT